MLFYAELIETLTTMRDEAMIIAKRAASVLLSSIMFDDTNAALSFKKFDEI